LLAVHWRHFELTPAPQDRAGCSRFERKLASATFLVARHTSGPSPRPQPSLAGPEFVMRLLFIAFAIGRLLGGSTRDRWFLDRRDLA